MSIRDRLLKNTTIDYTSGLDTSTVYHNVDVISTPIPMINVALSGKISGGLTAGLTVFAGPSKHFKSAFALVCAAAYLKRYPDATLLFYDSEFGTPEKYFTSLGISSDRVVHTPITTIEELRHDISAQLAQIQRNDRVVIVVDSLGNLASAKEVRDAEEGKEAADLTRAKVIKSLFRIVTPHLKLKNIPMITIMHTYETLEMFSKTVVGGGTGAIYSADTVLIIGRRQERDTKSKEVVGYDFILNVEKSRFVKEKAKIPITVSFKGGIMKWSGLFDIALESKHLTSITKVKYALATDHDHQYSRAELENNGEFWKKVLSTTDLVQSIEESYALPQGDLISDEQPDIAEVADLMPAT